MAEIEVAGPDEGQAPEAPYQNLFVPLIVVPAMIIIVLVLVFVLFGAIAGDEASPRENLARMLAGGANEREQAAFNLCRQAIEDWRAAQTGGEAEWGIDAAFLPQVRAAWDATGSEEYQTRYVLAVLLAQLGDPDGAQRLVEMLDVPDAGDPDGTIRFFVLQGLGLLADPATASAVIRFVDNSDHGLAQIAAAALQTLPGPESVAALKSVLASADLGLRGQAAISLTHLGDASGADVLRDMLDSSSFERERQIDRGRWVQAGDVSYARQRAAVALARLGRAEDLALLRRIAAEERDLNVREVALRALEEVR